MPPLNLVLGWAATLAQLLPPIPVIRLGNRAPPARRWVAVWAGVFFVADILQLVISDYFGAENLWFLTISTPIEDAVILWALSYWQTRPVFRLAFRVAIPLVVIIYLVIAFGAGEIDSFKRFSGPFRALLLLAASLFTLLRNLAESPEGVWTQDWLWTTLGVALYYGLFVAIEPAVAAVYPRSVPLAQLLYAVKSFGDVVAYVLIWQGMRCPLQRMSSGST